MSGASAVAVQPERTLLHVGPAPAPPALDSNPKHADTITATERIAENADFTRDLPTSATTREPREPTDESLRLEPGDRVPGTRYRIVRFIGDGGMGAVYEAQHLDIERRAALKILLPALSRSPSAARLFRREARTASKVGSDNIVQLYDFGELPDGRLMFTMELLSGPTLAAEVRNNGPLPAARAIGILRQLCKGLAAAHAAGIVHRDIKPENIVLETVKGRPDTVKILDFGIAAIVSDGSSNSPLDAGTPHVLAPELIAGVDFDGRADIYALGCTAYYLLTGQPPFTASGKDAIDRILDAHLYQAPCPLRLVRPDLHIPEALERVVLTCLEKLPTDRYANMSRLEAALCESQIETKLYTTWDDLPLPEVEPELRDRLLRDMPDPVEDLRPRRARWVWPVLTAAAVALAAAGTYIGMRNTDATVRHDSVADDIVAEARAAAAKMVYVYPPTGDSDAVTAYAKLRELEALDGRDAKLEAATLRQEFATTLVRLGDEYWAREGGKPFAIDYYRQALVFDRDHAIAAQRARLSPEALADLERRAADQDFSREEIAAAASLVALAESEGTPKEAGTRPATRAHRAPPRSASGSSPAARSAAEAAPKSDRELADAIETATHADVSEAAPPDETSQSAQSIADSGKRLLESGKHDEARLFFERALTFDPNNSTALLGLTKLAVSRNAMQEALRWAERLVAASPKKASHHLELGDIRFALEMYEAARVAYDRARSLGSSAAKNRLAKVDAKIGPPSEHGDDKSASPPEESQD